jgi:hypothetical protein
VVIPLRRADRNFAELLQELRVSFTGVQILLGFLLALSFSARFDASDDFQHIVSVERGRSRCPGRCWC